MFGVFRNHRRSLTVIIVWGLLAVALHAADDPPATTPTTAPTPSPTTAGVAPERLSVLAFNPVDAGRYLVKITGCNDCHTPAWEQSGGNIPESMWLTGVPVGFRGPWGTTYASNLRLYVQQFTADTWMQAMRARNVRPPMPWQSLHAMSESDLRAIYEYIKQLGPAGQPTPAYVPPNEEPRTPFIVFMPQMPGQAKAAAAEATQPTATGPTATPVVQPTSGPAK